MTVVEITSEEEFNKYLNDGLMIIDFYATWCGPCKMMAPIFSKLSSDPKYAKIKFCKLDIEEVDEVADACKVSSLPTFIAFSKGSRFDSITGSSEKDLVDLLDDLLEEE